MTTETGGLRYRDTGVDRETAARAKRRIGELVERTRTADVLSAPGGFGGLFRAPAGYRSPVLVSSADSVGTKVKVAMRAGRHDTVGVDIVNHCVDDILVEGARPLFFLDYIGIGTLDAGTVEALVTGLSAACVDNGCALIGGETAELPDLYAAGEYDLAGFAVGIVERARIIDGSTVKPGDVVLGLASSGLHANGYSLARRIVFDVLALGIDAMVPGTGRTVADVLLEPTRIYAGAVLPIREDVTAMAHITGGGLTGNLPRVLPAGCRALVRPAAWAERRPPIFRTLQEAGQVDDAEMFRTFNMGIGYVVVVRPDVADSVGARLTGAGEEVFVIGEVAAGERGVELLR